MPDPAKALPVELLLLISSFLAPQDIWRLRCLSKDYECVFSSSAAVEDALFRHESDRDSRPTELADRISLFRAHHTGRPAAALDLGMRSTSSRVLPNPVLAKHFLAYRDGDLVRIIDLTSGLRRFRRARGLHCHTLTETLLAISAGTRCYFNELEDLDEMAKMVDVGKQIRLMAGYGHLLAMEHEEGIIVLDTVTLQQRDYECSYETFSMRMDSENIWMTCAAAWEAVEELAVHHIDLKTGDQRDLAFRHSGTLAGIGRQTLHPSGVSQWSPLRILDDYWEPLHNHTTFWKGKLYTSRAPERNTIYVDNLSDKISSIGRIERREQVEEYHDSTLLVNDSFLIDWVGGRAKRFVVYVFDGSLSTVEQMPIVNEVSSAFAPYIWVDG